MGDLRHCSVILKELGFLSPDAESPVEHPVISLDEKEHKPYGKPQSIKPPVDVETNQKQNIESGGNENDYDREAEKVP